LNTSTEAIRYITFCEFQILKTNCDEIQISLAGFYHVMLNFSKFTRKYFTQNLTDQ